MPPFWAIFRLKARDLDKSWKEFNRLEEEETLLTKKLQELDSHPPSDVYLSSRDRQVCSLKITKNCTVSPFFTSREAAGHALV